MTRRTLLITSVGSQVGLAILDAIDAQPGLRRRLRIVGLNSTADAAQSFRCDQAWLVPETSAGPAYRDAVGRVLAAVGADLVFAGRDGDLEPLAALAAEPAFAAVAFAGPGAAVARITTDKYESHRFAQAHGLPFAETAASAAELGALIARHGFPLIAKPRRGAGSLQVYAVRRPAEAEAALAAGGFVFQPYLDPPAPAALEALNPAFGQPLHFSVAGQTHHSATTVIGRDGRLLGLFMGWHQFRRGETDRIHAEDAPALAAIVHRWAAALHAAGMVGPFNLQCRKLGRDAYMPIELNARFTGSSAQRALLGFDDVGAALDHFLWGREAPRQPSAPAGFVQYRRAAALVPAADAAALAATGRWDAPAADAAAHG